MPAFRSAPSSPPALTAPSPSAISAAPSAAAGALRGGARHIDVIEREGLIENAVAVGEYLAEGVRALGVGRVSAAACCSVSISVDPRRPVQRALFQHRILTGTATDPGYLRLLPPLSFSHREADLLLAGLKDVLQ